MVARGTGTLICGGQTFPLLPNDVAAIPAWTWHQLAASEGELVLLRIDGNRAQAQFVGGAQNSDGDFAAVQGEKFFQLSA